MDVYMIVAIVVVAAASLATLGLPFYFGMTLVRRFKFYSILSPVFLLAPVVLSFVRNQVVSGALYLTLLLLLLWPSAYRFCRPYKFSVNFFFVLCEFAVYIPLLALFPQYKQYSADALLFFLPFAVTVCGMLQFLIGFTARSLRFKYVSSTLLSSGKDFYKKFRYFLPEPHSQPQLPDHEWLQLARMSLICLCRKKRIFKLEVHRLIAFQDLYKELLNNDVNWLKYPIYVKFIGENAVDTGGLKNELFTLISQAFFELKPFYQKRIQKKQKPQTFDQFVEHIENQIYDPATALQMNESGSLMITQNLSATHAFMMGWLFGKCLYHNCVIPYNISDLLLSITIDCFDLESIADYDQDFARFIYKAEENEEEFEMFKDLLGEPKLDYRAPRKINLKSAVLLKYFPLSDKALRYLQKGFTSAFPEPASYFLTLYLCKTIVQYKEIDVDDWQRHTEIAYFPPGCCAPDLFFEMLRQRPAMKVPVLQFSTGLKNLPNGSFQWMGKPLFSGEASQKFKLEPIGRKYLPIASTCTYSLRLPVVETVQELEDKFKIALQCSALDNP